MPFFLISSYIFAVVFVIVICALECCSFNVITVPCSLFIATHSNKVHKQFCLFIIRTISEICSVQLLYFILFLFQHYFNFSKRNRDERTAGFNDIKNWNWQLAIFNENCVFTIDEMSAWVAAILWPIRNKANEKLNPIIDINSNNKWPQTIHKRYNYFH